MTDETITTPVTPPEEIPVSSIKDEDQFQDAIIAAQEKSSKIGNHERFAAIASEIHATLTRQDSEAALTLITR